MNYKFCGKTSKLEQEYRRFKVPAYCMKELCRLYDDSRKLWEFIGEIYPQTKEFRDGWNWKIVFPSAFTAEIVEIKKLDKEGG